MVACAAPGVRSAVAAGAVGVEGGWVGVEGGTVGVSVGGLGVLEEVWGACELACIGVSGATAPPQAASASEASSRNNRLMEKNRSFRARSIILTDFLPLASGRAYTGRTGEPSITEKAPAWENAFSEISVEVQFFAVTQDRARIRP